jgi:acyl-CoA thioester hydrolase
MYLDIKIEPRYEETDQMGVIYHGNYFTYFEVARTGLLKHFGYAYKEMEACGVMLPVIDVTCQYKKPIFYDDEIVVRTSVESIKGVRIKFQYQVIRITTDELLAIGTTTHAFSDLKLKPIRYKHLDEGLRKVFDTLLENEN